MPNQTLTPAPERIYHTSNDLYPTPKPRPLPQGVYRINALTSPGPRVLRAMNISEEALDANRQGYLSSAQRNRLLHKNTEWVLICFVGATLLTWPIAQIMSGTPEAVISWMWTMMIWGLFLKEFYNQTLIYRALLVGKVESLRGQVRVNGGISVHNVVGVEKHFTVTNDVYKGFVYNEDYTLYFLPQINQLVSAEHHPVYYQTREIDA